MIPKKQDTDGDLYWDSWELESAVQSDPTDPASLPDLSQDRSLRWLPHTKTLPKVIDWEITEPIPRSEWQVYGTKRELVKTFSYAPPREALPMTARLLKVRFPGEVLEDMELNGQNSSIFEPPGGAVPWKDFNKSFQIGIYNLGVRYWEWEEEDWEYYPDLDMCVNNAVCKLDCSLDYELLYRVDLDVDSDNNDGFNAPKRTPSEDALEHPKGDETTPGKILVVNDGDEDGDGVPNFADGFDKWGNQGAGAGGRFVPLILELPEPIDLAKAVVKFGYWDSDPDTVTRSPAPPYVYAVPGPPPGNLRIWKADGGAARKKAQVDLGGDFVKPSAYQASLLGSGRTLTLYVEGVRDSGPRAYETIEVQVDPDGPGPADFVCIDSVRILVLKVDIAMDGDRDGNIDFDKLDDVTCLFWVNDDYDVKHWEEELWHEDDDPNADGTIGKNCDDDYIGEVVYKGHTVDPHNCLRDLEDFTRLHVLVADHWESTPPGLTYWMRFENVSSGHPAVNVFEAIDETLSYLQDPMAADFQIQKTRLITVGATDVQLPNAFIEKDAERAAFLVEGKSEGKGDLTFVLKKDGREICKRSVNLELRPVKNFYQVFRVAGAGQMSADVSGMYNDDFTRSDDYLLFVHGFNVNATDKAYWPGTVFKRLWWQGYTGHFGWFDWPCVVRDWWDLDSQFFDSSENVAWQCGGALLHRLSQLNLGAHGGKVRLIAHSQGNIIAGEALRNACGVAVQAYIASQAAVSGDHYASGLPQNPNTYLQPFPTTPNVLADYPVSGSPYLQGVFQAVASERVFAYFNAADYALRSAGFSWERNNAMKPNFNYWYHEVDGDVDTYAWPNEYFFYDDLLPGSRGLALPDDRYEIFSHAAESRACALGTDVVPGFSSFNLQSMPRHYDGAHYSHSRQLRSNIVDERLYWRRVLMDSGLQYAE